MRDVCADILTVIAKALTFTIFMVIGYVLTFYLIWGEWPTLNQGV